MRVFIKFFSVWVVLLTIFSLRSNGQAQTKGSPPVITFSYAQEKIRQGEEWRIYISASDPDGDISRIYCMIDQPGGQLYRPDFTRLKKGMEEKFSGYLFLRTNSQFSLHGASLTLTLTIVDRAGNESKPVLFPLTFDGEPMKPLPADMEKELNQRIAAIGIDLGRRDAW
jgi:hypothetical protein